MEDKKENAIHIVTENVAIPEIRFDEDLPEDDEKKESGGIDFDVAIPEIHIKTE